MPNHHMGAERHSVFPPALFEKDRRFLQSVQTYILAETEKVGCPEQGPSEECYVIYSNAFDKIIEYVTAYNNILTSVKQAYEAFIARIKNGQRNAFFLHRRLQALSESTTLLYYRKRAMELEDKIKALQKNSARIKNVILEIHNVGKVPSEAFGTPEKTAHPLKPIPGLSVEESLSLDSLSKHLARRRVLELKKERGKKYARILLVANAISAWAKSDKIVTLQDLLSQIMKNKKDERALDSLVKRLKIHLSILKVSVNYFPNSAITLEAIKCALSEKQLNLVTHWVTQQRLTFSEAVGDSIYDSEKAESSNESKCLALAQVTYGQSGTHKKVALCLCIQGRISGAMDYIQQLEHFFFGFNGDVFDRIYDYFFLLQNCPSTALIRCFSQQWIRKPPFSSVGTTILSFISANHKKHGFELLEEMSKENALEQVILNDTICTLEDWNKIAVACAENKHEKLSQKIVSILTSQDGVFENSPLEDEKDAKIMEHVFWSSVPLCISFHHGESSKGRRISSGSLWRAGRLSTDLLSFNQVCLLERYFQ
ncbi:LOW QUALITY PROTEIN: clathrin heavy chain linker domain-containing protein 1 [Sarcoramphus papa]